MAKSFPEMTESEIRKAWDKVRAAGSRLCDEMIAAGRGLERPSETRLLTDELAVRVNAHSVVHCDIVAEMRRRETYHGSLKRIRSRV